MTKTCVDHLHAVRHLFGSFFFLFYAPNAAAGRCPDDWNLIATCIKRHYYDFDGFVASWAAVGPCRATQVSHESHPRATVALASWRICVNQKTVPQLEAW